MNKPQYVFHPQNVGEIRLNELDRTKKFIELEESITKLVKFHMDDLINNDGWTLEDFKSKPDWTKEQEIMDDVKWELFETNDMVLDMIRIFVESALIDFDMPMPNGMWTLCYELTNRIVEEIVVPAELNRRMCLDAKLESNNAMIDVPPSVAFISGIEVPYNIYDTVKFGAEFYNSEKISMTNSEFINTLVEYLKEVFVNYEYWTLQDFEKDLAYFFEGEEPEYHGTFFKEQIILNTDAESAPPLTAKTVMGSAPDNTEPSSEMEM